MHSYGNIIIIIIYQCIYFYAGSSVIDPQTATQYRIFQYLADLSELSSQEMDNDYNITSQTRNALDLYLSCMDTSAIESRGVQPLLDVLGYRGTLELPIIASVS